MPNVLVTGVNGFVGKHLVRELLSRKCSVIGVDYNKPAHAQIKNELMAYYDCNLNDHTAVKKLPLKSIDAIINLAGLAQVGNSFTNPELYRQVNVGVLQNIGEAMVAHGSSGRLIAISTGAVYDSVQPMPLTESSQTIKSGSPYALSKLAMEDIAHHLRAKGLECVVMRPFNHIGPGQGSGFLLPDLYSKIIEAAKTDGVVRVGNLTTKRDYTDVRDVATAYTNLVLAARLSFDIYNICSGKSVSGTKILELILKKTSLTNKITLQQDPALLRPNDPPDLYGDYSRLRQDTNWQPIIPLGQTISDIIASS